MGNTAQDAAEQETTQTESTVRVRIFINETPHVVRKRVMTGEELRILGEIPEGNQLFLTVSGPGDDHPIGRDERVKLRSGMRFYDVPVGNFG